MAVFGFTSFLSWWLWLAVFFGALRVAREWQRHRAETDDRFLSL